MRAILPGLSFRTVCWWVSCGKIPEDRSEEPAECAGKAESRPRAWGRLFIEIWLKKKCGLYLCNLENSSKILLYQLSVT